MMFLSVGDHAGLLNVSLLLLHDAVDNQIVDTSQVHKANCQYNDCQRGLRLNPQPDGVNNQRPPLDNVHCHKEEHGSGATIVLCGLATGEVSGCLEKILDC